MSGHTMEYSQSVEIRDNAISAGKGLGSNFLMEKRERANYPALDHKRKLDTIEDAAGEINGILIQCREVRISEIFAQTLLKIQTLTNAAQKLLGGKAECRHTCPGTRKRRKSRTSQRDKIRKTTRQHRNAPLPKKSMPTHRSNTHRENRKMQTKGQEQQKMIESIEKSNGGEPNYTMAR